MSIEDASRQEGRHPADDLLVPADAEQDPTLSVVMPTMNEEAGIEECMLRIKNALAELGVTAEIVVSDSSTDRTPEIARELGAIVVTPDKGGYGYAYRYAFDRVRGDYIAMGDADTTYDFEELPKLLDTVVSGDADMVMGSRLGGEIRPGAMPALHQYVGNPLLTKFLNVFYDAGVSDAHSGFRVFTRETLETLDLHTSGMEFASEMIMDAGAKDLKIEEVPITYHEREGEATLESFRDGWRHVRFMLVNAPGYLFSLPGLVLAVFGVLLMAGTLFGARPAGVWLGINTATAGAMLTLLGIQVGSLGLASTIATDPIRTPEDAITRLFHERFSLERGATAGFAVAGVGAAYAGYLVVRWASSGYEAVPAGTEGIVAATVILVGIQVVFSSFFLSILADYSQK
jgi:glycosyltransferase involved in cell wall biosynthesis